MMLDIQRKPQAQRLTLLSSFFDSVFYLGYMEGYVSTMKALFLNPFILLIAN